MRLTDKMTQMCILQALQRGKDRTIYTIKSTNSLGIIKEAMGNHGSFCGTLYRAYADTDMAADIKRISMEDGKHLTALKLQRMKELDNGS